MTRKPRQIERVEFRADELTQVVEHMVRLAGAGDGWINLIPKIAGEDEQPTSLRFFTLLGGGGAGVTMCTWVPGRREQRGLREPSIGIAHVTGKRAVAKLDSLEIRIPTTWRVEQDHPRRGLVLRLPPDESHERVLAWTLRAVTALSSPRAICGWRADVYLPATS